jgi:hypothetical protein
MKSSQTRHHQPAVFCAPTLPGTQEGLKVELKHYHPLADHWMGCNHMKEISFLIKPMPKRLT